MVTKTFQRNKSSRNKDRKVFMFTNYSLKIKRIELIAYVHRGFEVNYV